MKKLILPLFIAVLMFGLAMPAYAVVPVVKTVPWVATNPLIPHDTWSGKSITLKGTTDVTGTDFEYSWDFGDGGSTAFTDVGPNNYSLQAFHTYVGNVGDIFTARLTVRDKNTNETASKTYLVIIRAQTLAVEVNVAIDEGLWYLHKNQNKTTGSWSPISIYHGVWANAINAFEANGHVESLVGDDNPYKETVAKGLKDLFSHLTAYAIGIKNGLYAEDYNGDGVVDALDTGNNGLAIYNSQTYYYQHGSYMDAIVASGTPGAVTTTGPANVIGRTYGDIVQDMADAVSNGQYNHPTAVNRGGWTYSWGSGGDNSICQWAAIGIIPAVRNGWALIPPHVTALNPTWLVYSQHAAGYFGYSTSNTIWGPFATTPSGLVQMVMDGLGRGDGGTPGSPPAGFPSWDKAEKYLRDNFENVGGNYVSNIKEYYYGLFSFVKAMRLHVPPITMLRDYTAVLPDIDWYSDATHGVARNLVDDQDKSGGGNHGLWSGHYGGSSAQNQFHTPWAILMLGQSLFEAGSPVAVAKAVPNPGVAGQVITLDGSDSFHQDALKSIDSWDWDLDNDGVCDDASGPFAFNSWPAVGDYPVKLCVSDNGVGLDEKFAETTMVVKITTPPIAPTANPGGPYAFCPGVTWYLDGTGSVNPDDGERETQSDPVDFIKEYAWELNGDNLFDDAFGPQPDVTAFFSGLGTGDYLIQLRVTDNTALSFPSSGQPDLTHTASTTVSVKAAGDPDCVCIDDLSARAKRGEVQLTWTDTSPDHYNVYRSTTAGGPYTLIGTTTSTYSTFLDTTVVNGTTYYYVVRPAALNGDELCESNEASATPEEQRRRRR
ncbi:MAG: hypothetical protein K8F52_00340 [Candidatus Scalindua rubra]|uniref:Amylopullulanase n=1 Tax=Candidatus Scalindua brodae TaxID=237368 RepID=A0A0B0EML2_9BACT|nr:MAG: Amylopullulanase precursor [Candidatus Scalindua brodae]MBZ0107087.1 hypothetical protein [Candidatus Scalindua rubra]TWU32116.1 Amylopullulanase precursor [Candidatus Brocadiaceae bacterium S225]